MNAIFPKDILEANRLIREGGLAEASALLQRFRHGDVASPGTITTTTTGTPTARVPRIIDVNPDTATQPIPRRLQPPARHVRRQPAGWPAAGMGKAAMPQMPEALRGVLDQMNQSGLGQGLDRLARHAPAPETLPEGARYIAGSFGAEAGSRGYKLYIPSTRRD